MRRLEVMDILVLKTILPSWPQVYQFYCLVSDSCRNGLIPAKRVCTKLIWVDWCM